MIWREIFIRPLYNSLVFLVETIPGASLALAVIILTIIVKFLLYPLSKKSIIAQAAQRKLQPKVKELKESISDKQEQAKAIMELYKTEKMNPLSGCLLLLVQIPIILALYRVFLAGVSAQQDLLYKGLELSDTFQKYLFGIDLEEKSIILAVVAGVLQYIQISYSQSTGGTQEFKEEKKKKEDKAEDKKAAPDMAAMMQKQMRFMMPVMIIVFGAAVPAAVALYWVSSSVFMVGQEWYIRKQL